MDVDWGADVRKYVPDADETVIKGIIRYCGIALRSRDASLVSFTDPEEVARVRDNYCRKKLGLTDTDAEIDAAIAKVGERMSGDPTRNRVTVYYLLAEHFGKLGLFGATAAAAEPDPAPVAVPVAAPAAAAPLAASAPLAAAAVAAPAAAARAAPAKDAHDKDDGLISTALAAFGVIAVVILGTAILGSQIGDRQPANRSVAALAPRVTEAPAPAAPAMPAIPEGAGVVAEEIEGKPRVSVYFDTAKSDVTADFAAAAAPVKAWLDSHPGATLAVSGYNDPRGDAAMNAELSKNRAQAVAAALQSLGIPAVAIALVKPAETTDTTTTFENARRVDIVVVDAGFAAATTAP
jgi:outer membrane protein OmpA-like peptidoglycan-associated protein